MDRYRGKCVQPGQCDVRVNLSNGIHWTAHDWSLEYDIASDTTVGSDLVSGEIDLSGEHEEIVIGETVVQPCVHELIDRQSIRVGGIFSIPQMDRTRREMEDMVENDEER